MTDSSVASLHSPMIIHFPASRYSFISLLGILFFLPACGKSEAGMEKPPTEKEIVAYFVKTQEDSAMHDVVRPAIKAETAVTEIKVGSKMQKQVGRGEEAREVWALKAHVLTKISLLNGTVQTRELRLEPNQAWFFYRDAFGEWAAKYGPM